MARVIGKGLLGLAALISAGVVVVGAALYVVERYNDHYRWRYREYAKLRSLHAGYSVARFEAVLGTPLFSRKHSRSGLREDSFRRRDYWVQTVSRRDGTVVLYSITACDPEFRPTFTFPGNDGRARVVLNETTFAGVFDKANDASVKANYTLGNTANTTLMDEWYGANPANYKEYSWGLNDACPGSNGFASVYKMVGNPSLKRYPYRGGVTKGGRWVDRFRQATRVNTYAETPPHGTFDQVHRSFQTGVDRILTRTAQ